MEQNQAKGAGFLKVCGIIMIIGGALSIIIGILAVVGALALTGMGIDAGVSTGLLMVASILALVGGIIELIAGIIGVKNCNDPSKANTCLICGIVVVAVSVLSTILTVVAGGNFSPVSFVTGLILPALYIVGAVKNKQA